jgi:hypothetical protein
MDLSGAQSSAEDRRSLTPADADEMETTSSDSRLDRSVAIKVFQAHLTENQEARLRFEREAKAIAAISLRVVTRTHLHLYLASQRRTTIRGILGHSGSIVFSAVYGQPGYLGLP